jgi:peptidoglycan/LPS O-acetylase OafA/YrhL
MKTRDIELDFVRGIAILLALGWHFNVPDFGAPLNWLLAPGRTMGWAGVDLFFVLSGFLIGGLLFGEYKETGAFNARRFLIRRAFKIWPVLYIFLALQLVVASHPWPSYLFQNLFHVQNFWRSSFPHLWSLAVEEHFYLVFAAGYAVLTRQTATARTLPYYLAGILVVTLVLRICAVAYGVGGQPIQLQTQFRIDALACGVLLAYFKTFHLAGFERVASWKIATLAVWLPIAVLLGNQQQYSPFISTIGFTLAYLAAAAFILFCYRASFLLSRNWPARAMAWIGVYSYATYVFQFTLVKFSEAAATRMHFSQSNAQLFVLFCSYAGAIVAGVLVTLVVERPSLMMREKLFPKKSFEPPDAEFVPDTTSPKVVGAE